MVRRTDRARTVGIDAIGVDPGAAAITVDALSRGDAAHDRRVRALGMEARGVALPCDDPVTFGTTAGRRVLEQLTPDERDGIELLVFATECGLDLSKSLCGSVHRLLGLPSTCRTVEMKQACYSATAAVQLAAAVVSTSPRPGARALVVTGDIGHHPLHSLPEAVTGVGGVAVLVSAEPRIAALRLGLSGLHCADVSDTLRPSYTEEVIDPDLSLLSYLECLRFCWQDYAARVPGADFLADFDLLAMHTPFAAMVKGAHRTLTRDVVGLTPTQIDADFERRVEPSLAYVRRTGNIYTGTSLLCLISAVAHGGIRTEAAAGVFSYGSGCSAEFYGCDIAPGAADRVADGGVREALDSRCPLDFDHYARFAGTDVPAGVRNAGVDLEAAQPALRHVKEAGSPRLMLTGVEDYRRHYAWTDGAPW
ncbi:hydroxymethylglutaryl-CoA synthase family protein [Streptomyces sp. NPDC013161]|uniref:hydroxymethylglutaryl-CoA synthase family protein n=1 Tax=Streptomyces sp. NPDC013161 TaxID=3364862 RepID=UPI0036CFB9A6